MSLGDLEFLLLSIPGMSYIVTFFLLCLGNCSSNKIEIKSGFDCEAFSKHLLIG